MNLGKVGFDPGHYAGANKYKNYSEGNTMLELALILKSKGFYITRETSEDITLLGRIRKAIANGCDTLISLHTDWVPEGKESSTEGVMPIYSLNIPEDKSISDELGHGLAKAMGIKFKQLYTRNASKSTKDKPLDYYGILRYGVKLGLKHVIIIEHCNHAQMSIDTTKKLQAIAEYYFETLEGGKMNSIIGKSVATAEQMTAYLKKVNPNAPDVAQIFLEEGANEGIMGDKAFCQACKETNFWRFGGLAKADWNNPAGLGVTGQVVNGVPIGNKFPDLRTGIRAQIQHLKAYATKEPLKQTCVDTRYSMVTKGSAPNWENLNGKWAVPGTTYGQDIIKMWNEVIKIPAIDYKSLYETTKKLADSYKAKYDNIITRINNLIKEI